MRTSCLPYKLMRVMLRFFAAAVLALLTLKSPVLPAIVIDPDDARPVSPLLYGSQVFWPRQGGGALVAPYHRLRIPVTFNTFFVEKAREMPVATLRFQGDNVYYWRYGVGPLHLRPGANFSHYGSNIWSNDFGTHEFVNLCRIIGAEPVIVAPYLVARRPAENAPIATQLAANWVEYCNAPSPGLDYGRTRGWEPTTFTNSAAGLSEWEPGKNYSPGERVRLHGAAFLCIQAHYSDYALEPGSRNSDWLSYWRWLEPEEVAVPGKSWKATEKAPSGYFAWLRELFGSPEPFRIRYWEIGNEEWAWGRPGGYSWGRPEQYAANALEIIRAMKSVDPTIQCGINMPGPLDWDRKNFQEKVCGKPGNYSATYQAADFIVWHISIGTNIPNITYPDLEYRQQFEAVEAYERAHQQLMRDYPKPSFITEFNVRYGLYSGANPADQVHMHRLKSGLIFACMFNQFARLGVTAVHQLLFAEVGAWYETRLFRMVYQDVNDKTKQRRQGVTPTYLVMQLYSKFGRGDVLKTTIHDDNGLHAQAFRDQFNKRVRLFVVNQSSSDAKRVIVDFGRLRVTGPVRVMVLSSPDGMEASNEDTPGSVQVTESVVSDVSSILNGYVFPPHSLTLLDIPEDEGSVTPDLDVTITASKSDPLPGDSVVFMVTARNMGVASIKDTEVVFRLPAEAEYVRGTATPDGVYDSEMNGLRWRVSGLGPGSSRQFQCEVRIR